jgi:hypothetical protein
MARRLLAGLALAMFASTASAAPFCVVTSYAQQCWYYDYPSCQRAAQTSRGACVAQQEQQPTYERPQRAAGAPFCVVASYGTNCWYYDAPSCQRAAQSAQGACVVNPDR